jgi:PhnB protein
MAVKAIPEGYHSLTPYLTVEGAAQLIEFLKKAFDAQERHRSTRPDGTVWHAELFVGNSPVMIAEPTEAWKPMSTALYFYLDDVDAAYKRALAAGATSMMPPTDQFYGDRMAGVLDPSKNIWWLATHIEDVSPEELARRQQAVAKQAQNK